MRSWGGEVGVQQSAIMTYMMDVTWTSTDEIKLFEVWLMLISLRHLAVPSSSATVLRHLTAKLAPPVVYLDGPTLSYHILVVDGNVYEFASSFVDFH